MGGLSSSPLSSCMRSRALSKPSEIIELLLLLLLQIIMMIITITKNIVIIIIIISRRELALPACQELFEPHLVSPGPRFRRAYDYIYSIYSIYIII